MASGNLKDCGCRDSNYENCEELFGGLRIINVTDDNYLKSLENIRRINGFIDIQNSTLEDLSFMKKVESIGIKNFGLSDKISINIQNNLKMTRLGLPLQNILFNFEYNRIANLENLHSDFCITIEEMINFLELNLFFVNIHARYCDSVGNLQGCSLCRFDEMSNLKSNCEYVFGAVEIGSDDEESVKKLRKMTHLFGSLSIENTKLKDLDFLGDLRYIANLDESRPPIQINSNPNLKSAFLPSLLNIITKRKQYAEIQDNHPSLFNSSEFHLLFPNPFQSRAIYANGKYFRLL
ncbi:unnamed protein product [Caenorhabditis brenneri]